MELQFYWDYLEELSSPMVFTFVEVEEYIYDEVDNDFDQPDIIGHRYVLKCNVVTKKRHYDVIAYKRYLDCLESNFAKYIHFEVEHVTDRKIYKTKVIYDLQKKLKLFSNNDNGTLHKNSCKFYFSDDEGKDLIDPNLIVQEKYQILYQPYIDAQYGNLTTLLGLVVNKFDANLVFPSIIEEMAKESFLYIHYSYPDRLRKSYNELVRNKFLEPNKFKDFELAFSGKKIMNKVNWTGPKRSLRYYINSLLKFNLVKSCDQYILASKCFFIKGKTFTNDDLKGNNSKPANTKLLDSAIEFLK